jgi:crossover junction endodeoxyribonuclease RuvC
VILALDIATRCGWAAGLPGATPEWGSRLFRSDEGGTGQVVSMFRAWLGEMCSDLRPRQIVFESPWMPHPGGSMPMNIGTLRRLYAMVETSASVAFERRISIYETPTAQATKFLTGRARWGVKGDTYDEARAKKKAAVIAACLRHGWDVKGDEDAADGLAIWCAAEDQLAPDLATQRRRAAADRERLTAGEGPLFKPENANAPGPDLPGALSQPDDRNSSNGLKQKNTNGSRKIQSAAGELFRKSA